MPYGGEHRHPSKGRDDGLGPAERDKHVGRPGGQDSLPRLEAVGDALRAQASLLDGPIGELHGDVVVGVTPWSPKGFTARTIALARPASPSAYPAAFLSPAQAILHSVQENNRPSRTRTCPRLQDRLEVGDAEERSEDAHFGH